MKTTTLLKFGLLAALVGGLNLSGLAGQVRAQDGGADAQSLLKRLESLPAAEREKKLVDGAKKERSVVWYTVDSPKVNQKLAEAFNKKYPFIEVYFMRAKSRAIADRITTETRANKYLFDLATTSTETFNLYDVKEVFARYNSPAKERIPASMKGERWASLFTFIRAVGYNTDLVKEEDVPKTWEDLLDPRWKGKIMFDESSLPEVAMLYRSWGKEKTSAYLERLGRSGNLQIQRGRSVITQLLAAGEAPLGVTVYAYSIETFKKKGAPVDWALLDPTPGMLQITSVARRAPHPYSAALLYDFVLGDGQKVFAAINRVPANPDVKAKIPRMGAAIRDSRFVLDNPESPDPTDEILRLLDAKILKPALENR